MIEEHDVLFVHDLICQDDGHPIIGIDIGSAIRVTIVNDIIFYFSGLAK